MGAASVINRSPTSSELRPGRPVDLRRTGNPSAESRPTPHDVFQLHLAFSLCGEQYLDRKSRSSKCFKLSITNKAAEPGPAFPPPHPHPPNQPSLHTQYITFVTNAIVGLPQPAFQTTLTSPLSFGWKQTHPEQWLWKCRL